jgi:hypothetical protein
MFAITVIVRTIPFRFVYKEEAAALLAISALSTIALDFITLTDDFGQTLYCKREHLSGWIVEDLERSKLAAVEIMLHQQRTQNLAQKMAQSDPSLRHVTTSSPGVLTPFSRN